MSDMRLITIRFSHYNERARWALDRLGVGYTEEPWMPLFHFPAVVWATRGRGSSPDRVSTRFSTPLLLTDDGQRIGDSGAIVRWASDRFGTEETSLYPAAHRREIEAFEQRMHDEIGPHTRRIAYSIALLNPALMKKIAEANVGPRQAAAFGRALPIVSAMIRRALAIGPVSAQRSLDRLRARRDALGKELEGRRYLFGDRFTAADLTLACMFAPAILPSVAEGYGGFLPAPEELPPHGLALVREARATEVGRFCLRMFGEERGRRRIPCAVGATASVVLH